MVVFKEGDIVRITAPGTYFDQMSGEVQIPITGECVVASTEGEWYVFPNSSLKVIKRKGSQWL